MMPTVPSWLQEAGLQRLFGAVEARGGEARAVGGCVRDFLLGVRGGDVDIACTLRPEVMMEIGAEQSWKAIPTGLAHGTVTLVLPERVVEVTTLRRDVTTDGRHAEVAFTQQFEEDAARRDFTMNALYMDFRGYVNDYFGGEEDIRAQRVRFIGTPGDRIREDGLRILRFFRFLATHGKPPADDAAIRAIAGQRGMLEKLSGERIQQEMKKLLGAADPTYALTQMCMLALGQVLTGAAWHPTQLSELLQREQRFGAEGTPWVRLLAMIDPAQHVAAAGMICERWKLSRADMAVLEFLTAPPVFDKPHAVKEALRHYKREWVQQSLLLQSLHNPEVSLQASLPLVRSWDVPVFPIAARDLLDKGIQEGRELGVALRILEQRWVESEYRLRREDLLGLV